MADNQKEALELKKEILDTGSYVQTEIVVSEKINRPYITTKLHGCTPAGVVLLFKMLDEVQKELLNKYPFITSTLKHIQVTEHEIVELDKKGDEE